MYMKNLFWGLLALFFFCGSAPAAELEKGVLLPVTGPLTPHEKDVLAETVAESFKNKYNIIYGADVNSFVVKVFEEESKKHDCDETACYRKIAEHFHASVVIALRITKKEERDQLVTLSVFDVLEEKVVHSGRKDCHSCSYEELKALCEGLVEGI